MSLRILTGIEARIKRLEMIRELARDPEALKLMTELVIEAQQQPPQPLLRQRPLPIPHDENGNGNGNAPDRPRRGEQQKAVEQALGAALVPVSTDWIVQKMKEDGFVFAASQPNVAVNECLRQAEKKGRAEIAGRNGVANLWKKK